MLPPYDMLVQCIKDLKFKIQIGERNLKMTQESLHKLVARVETLKEILSILEGEEEVLLKAEAEAEES